MAFKQLKLWFDADLAILLSEKILAVDPDFNAKKFIKDIEQAVPTLELKDRVAFIAQQLHILFDEDYKNGVSVMMQILGPENEEETGMFSNFYWVMPIAKYVEDYGLNNFSQSMKAIANITKRNTGEYAIRPYLRKYPSKTFDQMKKWSSSKNVHVRRLSSEGVRPRLPWASKLDSFVKNPKPIFSILENLKDDKSKYVQKSVANCINDIIKDNEPLAKELIERWSLDPTKERRWIIRHAIRNLVKQKDPWVVEITSSSK